MNGIYSFFNNNREQGLMLQLYDTEKDLCIWSCECRNSDDIMVVISNTNEKVDNCMFNDDAYNKAKYFKYDDYDSAVEYVYKQIKYIFRKRLNNKINVKFDCNRSIEDIRKIQEDAEELDYEDYYDIATFYDKNEKYFCDLIVLNGKMGLRYSKETDDHDFENLHFEECSLNLENEVTLMLDMHNKLENFINNELEYSIQYDKYNIKTNNDINKSYILSDGSYFNFHKVSNGYDFTIYDENKSFINGGTIDFYFGQKHDITSIIQDIADFTGYKQLLSEKEEIDSLEINNIKI